MRTRSQEARKIESDKNDGDGDNEVEVVEVIVESDAGKA